MDRIGIIAGAVLLAAVACTSSPAPDASTSIVRSSNPTVLPSPSSSLNSTPSVGATSTPSIVPPVVFAVKGDWGDPSSAHRAVTNRMCAMRASLRFKVVVTTGDNFYDPDGNATPGNYGTPERCLYSASEHRWRATWGNHDAKGRSTGTTLRSARFYTWTLRGVHFIMLDSNHPSDRAQRSFLDSTLVAARGEPIVVVFHHPPYTAGSKHTNDRDVQRYWVPSFERHKVALVLTGHAHLYERHVVRGINYVVTGGGGRYLHACARRPSSLRKCAAKYHFLAVTLADHAISVRAIDRMGKTFDRFSVALG